MENKKATEVYKVDNRRKTIKSKSNNKSQNKKVNMILQQPKEEDIDFATNIFKIFNKEKDSKNKSHSNERNQNKNEDENIKNEKMYLEDDREKFSEGLKELIKINQEQYNFANHVNSIYKNKSNQCTTNIYYQSQEKSKEIIAIEKKKQKEEYKKMLDEQMKEKQKNNKESKINNHQENYNPSLINSLILENQNLSKQDTQNKPIFTPNCNENIYNLSLPTNISTEKPNCLQNEPKIIYPKEISNLNRNIKTANANLKINHRNDLIDVEPLANKSQNLKCKIKPSDSEVTHQNSVTPNTTAYLGLGSPNISSNFQNSISPIILNNPEQRKSLVSCPVINKPSLTNYDSGNSNNNFQWNQPLLYSTNNMGIYGGDLQYIVKEFYDIKERLDIEEKEKKNNQIIQKYESIFNNLLDEKMNKCIEEKERNNNEIIQNVENINIIADTKPQEKKEMNNKNLEVIEENVIKNKTNLKSNKSCIQKEQIDCEDCKPDIINKCANNEKNKKKINITPINKPKSSSLKKRIEYDPGKGVNEISLIQSKFKLINSQNKGIKHNNSSNPSSKEKTDVIHNIIKQKSLVSKPKLKQINHSNIQINKNEQKNEKIECVNKISSKQDALDQFHNIQKYLNNILATYK